MDPFLARLLTLAGVAMICITGFAAYWMKLRHERRMLGTGAALQRLQQEVEELRTLTRSQVNELEERLDFADRLLGQQRSRLKGESRIPTPV